MILAGTIVLVVKVGRSDKTPPAWLEKGIMDVNDDQYWKAGLFYFNKNDPSIFVEKRFGVGWTINLANPIGFLILICPNSDYSYYYIVDQLIKISSHTR